MLIALYKIIIFDLPLKDTFYSKILNDLLPIYI